MATPSSTIGSRGRFHTEFLWRTTGFPCELLEQLGLDTLAGDIRNVVSRRADRRRWRESYPGLVGESLTNSFTTEFAGLRRRLNGIVRDRRFQIAVASSSPTAAATLRNASSPDTSSRRSKEKRLELLGIRYLQRFVTKCETAGFFGPVAAGRIGDVAGEVVVEHDTASYRGVGFLGDRFLTTLLRRLRREPEILWHARVKRRSGVTCGPQHALVHPRFGILQVNQRVAALVASASSPTPVRVLLDGWPDGRTTGLDAVRALLEIDVFSDDLEDACHCRNPIDGLRPHVVRAGDHSGLVAMLDELDDAVASWPRLDAAARQQSVTAIVDSADRIGIAAVSHGQFYRDHLPLVEDGFSSGCRLSLDEHWADPFLRDLESVVRSSLWRDAVRGQRLRRAIAQQFTSRGCRAVALPEFLGVVAEMDPAVELQPTGGGGPDFSTAVITSPDVLIAARDLPSLRRRECSWVLSECHSSVGAAGFFVRPMPDQERWLAAIDQFLSLQFAGAQLVVVTGERSNKTAFQGSLQCARYMESELSAPSGVRTIALEELDVRMDDELQLVVRESGTPLVLLPGPLAQAAPLLNCFRTPRFEPLRSGAQAGTRERYGSVVHRRAQWELPNDDLPACEADALEAFAWAQEQRATRGLPRWIFARPVTERKPICVDLSNPFLCEELRRLVRNEPRLCVEEMYPAPDEAWIRGEDGRYLGELRLLYAAGAA